MDRDSGIAHEDIKRWQNSAGELVTLLARLRKSLKMQSKTDREKSGREKYE